MAQAPLAEGDPSVLIALRLPASQASILDYLATAAGVSRSDYIRAAIAADLRKHGYDLHRGAPPCPSTPPPPGTPSASSPRSSSGSSSSPGGNPTAAVATAADTGIEEPSFVFEGTFDALAANRGWYDHTSYRWLAYPLADPTQETP